MDTNSSDESEFVDATQTIEQENSIETQSQKENKICLQNSWNNIAGKNDTKVFSEEEMDVNAEFMKFQLALSKSQKKNLRHKARSRTE